MTSHDVIILSAEKTLGTRLSFLNGGYLGCLDFPLNLKKPSKIGSKLIKTTKTNMNDRKTSKILEKSFSLIFLIREIAILINILVKIWLPWKRQVTWTMASHTKFLPDNFKKTSPSLVARALRLRTLLTFKVAAGRICFPPTSSTV